MSQNLSVPGIYAIEHAPTKRAYVGLAEDIGVRWARHRRALRNKTHHNKPLQRAWNKYGEDAFVIRVIADLSHVPEGERDAILSGYELSEMAKRGPRYLYNTAPGGAPRSRISEETRQRLSERKRALWADPAFRERRAKAHAEAMANPDMQRRRAAAISATKSSDEYRAKQSERTKAYWEDPAFREKRSASLNKTWADPERRRRHGEAISKSWATRRAKAANP